MKKSKIRKHKFFKFTVEGDSLNPQEIKTAVNLPSKIFIKGQEETKYKILQKTNRWLFCNNLCDEKDGSEFLTENLKIVEQHLTELQPYLEKFDSYIELVVYAENETDLTLSKEQIALLNKIGAEFLISFC